MSFESLTDEKIQSLLSMPKRVTNPKARLVADANHSKQDYNVESEDGLEDFVLFLRQNKSVELVNDLHISGLETKPDHPELFK
jgi:hypothetical protein